MKDCCSQCHQPHQRKSYNGIIFTAIAVLFIAVVVLACGRFWSMSDRPHAHSVRYADRLVENAKNDLEYADSLQTARTDSLNKRIDELESSIAKLQSSTAKNRSLITELGEKLEKTNEGIAVIATNVKQAFWILWEICNKITEEEARTDKLYQAIREYGAKEIRHFLFWKRPRDENLKNLGK